jgi:hypothetical protein
VSDEDDTEDTYTKPIVERAHRANQVLYNLARGHIEKAGWVPNEGKKPMMGFRLSRQIVNWFVKSGGKIDPPQTFSFPEVREIVKRAVNGDKRILEIIFTS